MAVFLPSCVGIQFFIFRPLARSSFDTICSPLVLALTLLSQHHTIYYLRARQPIQKTLAGAWAGGTEYGVNFVLLIKIVCLVLCVTSFLFVIFLVDLKVFSYILCLIILICVELKLRCHAKNRSEYASRDSPSCRRYEGCCCCDIRAFPPCHRVGET